MVEKFFNSMEAEVYRGFLYALYSGNQHDLSDEDIGTLIQTTREFTAGADKTGSLDPNYANLVIAVELMVNRKDIQMVYKFPSLGLSESDISAIKFAADITQFSSIDSPLESTLVKNNEFIMHEVNMEECASQNEMVSMIEVAIGKHAVEVIESGSITNIVKLMFARSVLNHLISSVSFSALVPYINSLSEFILSHNQVDTFNVGELLNEVTSKWK